jgi:REP element-mobilizing transposase RayT
MERLASVFAIDILTYAILSNHMHIVARTRPDIVRGWSDKEVALRWLRIFPGCRIDEHLGDPTTNSVDALANDANRIKQIRIRLSDPSWFMKALCEPIARLANFQDNVTGHFWEGRFKAQAITDEAGLLACSMYVDLNPIRAAMTTTPEESIHTSAYDRIQALDGKTMQSAAVDLVAIPTDEAARIIKTSTPEQLRKRKAMTRRKRGTSILRDAWLSPLTLNESSLPGPLPSSNGLRASDKGFLSMGIADYIKLLIWTSQQRVGGLEKPTIPDELKPILTNIGIDGKMWCDLVWNFKKYFGRASAAGSPDSIKESAHTRNRKFVHGQKAVAGCFGNKLAAAPSP